MSTDTDPIYQTVVDSINDAFGVMLMADVDFLKVEEFDGSYQGSRFIATIGLGGDGLEGVIHLVLSPASAEKVVGLMLGEEPGDEATLKDGVGELGNLVGGGVKKRLHEEDLNFTISLPTVMAADNTTLSTASATAVYPFQFMVESKYLVEGIFLIREREPDLAN